MKFPPRTTGLFQATAVATYVVLFAILAQLVPQWLKAHNIYAHPILGIILFLLVFITSALICASLVFVYPILLFFDSKKIEAVKTVLWSMVWLAAFFLIFGVIGILVAISGL